VLKAIYRAKTETQISAETIEEGPNKKQMVRQAFELLESWHDIPGMENGVIDAAKLENWVAEARRLSDEADRIEPCDVYIGRVLAYSPVGDDDIWPAEAVRKVIEVSRSEVIERNIAKRALSEIRSTSLDAIRNGLRQGRMARKAGI